MVDPKIEAGGAALLPRMAAIAIECGPCGVVTAPYHGRKVLKSSGFIP
jgi:hypothetical protein